MGVYMGLGAYTYVGVYMVMRGGMCVDLDMYMAMRVDLGVYTSRGVYVD